MHDSLELKRVPAAASVIEMASLLSAEKLSELFSLRLAVAGALALGGELGPTLTRLATVGITPGVTAGSIAAAGSLALAWPLPVPTTPFKPI